MRILGNIILFVLSGAVTGLLWCFAGIIWSITVIGIPVGKQCFKIARLCFFPFVKTVEYTGGTGSLLLNMLWIKRGSVVKTKYMLRSLYELGSLLIKRMDCNRLCSSSASTSRSFCVFFMVHSQTTVFQLVGLPTDIQNMSMMQKLVQQCRCQNVVAEQLAPVAEILVGG